MRLTLDGITIDVSEADANFYLRCGYKKVEKQGKGGSASTDKAINKNMKTQPDKPPEVEKDGET